MAIFSIADALESACLYFYNFIAFSFTNAYVSTLFWTLFISPLDLHRHDRQTISASTVAAEKAVANQGKLSPLVSQVDNNLTPPATYLA